MSNRSAEVFQEALSLPLNERAELIERLLSSLDTPERQRIDALWAQEAEDRLDAFERGEIKTISAQKVFDKIDGQRM
jgi:putative addiction module component (TIGR02574 family)